MAIFFFIKQKTAYEMRISDWSSDVCSSDLNRGDAKRLVSLEKARAQRFEGGWNDYAPPEPKKTGITVFDDYPLQDLLEVIDWTPFFQAWELAGKFPAILEDEVVGKSASELYRDARAMLARIIADKWVTAKAVLGLWPANSRGDDVIVEPAPEGQSGPTTRHFLRPQSTEEPRARKGGGGT